MLAIASSYFLLASREGHWTILVLCFWLAAWHVQMIKYSAFLQSGQTIGLAFCFAV